MKTNFDILNLEECLRPTICILMLQIKLIIFQYGPNLVQRKGQHHE